MGQLPLRAGFRAGLRTHKPIDLAAVVVVVVVITVVGAIRRKRRRREEAFRRSAGRALAEYYHFLLILLMVNPSIVNLIVRVFMMVSLQAETVEIGFLLE